ncbi:hypothetical protein L615_003600000150 [Nocardioides sp. J9]|uniref:DUF6069 family protein n=1 Tax=Nocardioides sp. J9 TaxID=935844 RepID=UPI0011A0B489|nr:DUF6069 family protein [Nocardioides sp. J9]TWG97349.1 hypothetical protein L615_003600000150 [Nocardioides sp. J9]
MSVITSTTASTASTSTASAARTPRRVPLVVAASGAVVAGAAATTAFELLARAVGVDIALAFGTAPEPMPVGGFFTAVVALGLVGVVIAAVLSRFARRPRRTWTRAAWALTVVSLVPPMLVSTPGAATNAVLVLAHVVPAVVIVPLVARRLAPVNPRRA